MQDEVKKIIGNRIRDLRIKNGYEQSEVAEKLNYKSDTTISKWESGSSLPTGKKLVGLALLFNTSTDYILFGIESKKDTTLTQPPSELVTAITDKVVQLTTPRQQNVLGYATDQLERQQKEEAIIEEDIEEHYKVDTVSSLAAGFGFAYDDNDIVTLTVANEPPRHDIASTVDGDSMLPDYQDGDVVYLVDVGFSHYSGQVCAVVVDNNTYLKKVYTEPNGLRLVSINPNYPDKFIDFPPTEDTHIKIFKVVDSDTPV